MESGMKQVVVEEPLVSPRDPQAGGTATLGLSLCPVEMLGTGLCLVYPGEAPRHV